MQRVNEFVFYELAVKVHALTAVVTDSFKYSENWSQLWDARESVDQLYNQRALNFTTPAALRLYHAISSVLPVKFDDVMGTWAEKTSEEADAILPYRVSEIREAAKEFETVLRSECQMMDTYFVSKKGAFSTKDLVENAHHQIPEPSRSQLPEQAKLDFDQGGKCIAFDVPTAAAFHLLRGTEKVLVDYYKLVVPGNKQAKEKMRNWGVYIKLLKSYDADLAVINVIDHLRDVYRNPVTHPDENYTDENVQVLFGLCVSAVVLILKAIDKVTAKGGALPFPVMPPVLGTAP